MEATESEENGDIVESELLTDIELQHDDTDGIYPCHYRNHIQVRPVSDSPSPNFACQPETPPTYSAVPGPEKYVLRHPYTHIMGRFIMDNGLEFHCELPSGKE